MATLQVQFFCASASKQHSRLFSFLQTAKLGASLTKRTLRTRCTFQKRVVLSMLQPGDGGEEENKSSDIPSTTGLENEASPALDGVIAGLASLGFVETAYLTYMRISGGPVTCPVGGGSCEDVLTGPYSSVFGVPLSAVGALAYGTVAVLGVLGVTSTSYRVAGVDVNRWLLLGSTGAMATASLYFMYILATKLEGASCAYCVASALLSVGLLLLTLRVRDPSFGKLGTWIANRFGYQEIKQVAGVQLAVTAAVIVTLSSAYAGITPALTGSGDIDLPPVEPQITTSSSSATLSLAKHLQSVGAKMYGAFWCSHCYEQKQMFGREAMKYLEYIECYPEGYRRGVKIAKPCESAKIDGFPTWIIKGKVLSGEQELTEIARVAGFDGLNPTN